METPNYVLYANEAELRPKQEKQTLGMVRKVVWLIIAAIIVGSLIFGENMFNDLSWYARWSLISMALATLFISGEEKRPSPFEIRFYNECFIVYRKKYCYGKKTSRMEYNKFYYKDIEMCQYKKRARLFNICGIEEATWYDYNKDGTVPDKPTYHRIGEGRCYFYTHFAGSVDFVAEIEQHSPLTVRVEN